MQSVDTDVRDGVRSAYSAAAANPTAEHPFPTGRAFAEQLGYPADLLDSLPPTVVEPFAGVSCASLFADMPAGATVLDLGCGAGLDSFTAAQAVGPDGRVIGVDFSQPMLERAHQAAATTDMANLSFLQADGEHLPIGDGVIDVALVNGIFNLNPARDMIFHELARVVRPGGAVFAAELILRESLTDEEKSQSNWFA